MGANAVIEVVDHGVTAMPPNPASYYAEHQPSMREDLKPISITQPEGVSFTVNGNLVEWQKWQFRIAFDPYEGLVLHQITYADDGRRRSILHRVDLGDGRALRRSEPAARVEERVRRGRVGTRPDDPAAHARLRLPRRDLLLRRDARHRAGQAVGDPERDLHARRGLRDALEARRPDGRPVGGAPQPPARRELRRDRRQLRVRLLLVLLPRRQHPARGEAVGHRVADGDRAGDPARVRQRRRDRRRRAAPSAHVQRAARLRRRRPGQRGLRGRGRTAPARTRQPVDERVPPALDAARHRARGSSQHRRGPLAHVADRESARAQRPRPARSPTSSCRR